MNTGYFARKERNGAGPEAAPRKPDRAGSIQSRAGRSAILAAQLRAKSQRLNAGLSDLAKLRKTLQTGDMIAAEWDLSLVAEEVLAIGTGVSAEAAALANLINQNLMLSRQIDSVGGDIRFLAAIVSQARVAIASIGDGSGDLESFGRDLATIATNAAQTVRDYGVEHAALLDLLETTASRHRAFEETAGARLLVSALDLEASAAELSRLRQCGDAAVSELSNHLDQIRNGLDQAAIHCETAASGAGLIGSTLDRREADAAAATLAKLALACLETHAGRSANVGQGNVRLAPDGSGTFFLDKLGPKLNEARLLFEECRNARQGVESLTVKVIPTFEILTRMAESVAVMVAEIMISGTNAIVKSHRIGSQGAALSVIAQHLRSHALRVADGINALAPLLAAARALNNTFLETLDKSGAGHLTAISDRMGWVVDSFVAVDQLSADVMHRVKLESAALEEDLLAIAGALRFIADDEEGTPAGS